MSDSVILPKNGIDPHGMIIGEGQFQYRVNNRWGILDKEKYPVENCHDFAIDSQQRIYMVTDHPDNQVIVYDVNGNVVDAFGKMFPGAHAIEIVKEGNKENDSEQEFIYLVDSGWITNRNWDGVSTDAWDSPKNKVIAQAGFIAKLTLDGQLLFTISHPQTIGIYTPDMPYRPTDIAVNSNGDIYVCDGYGSDYVIQYDKQGRYIRHFGGHDNKDANHNLVNAHGIAIDTRNPEKKQLIISSRAEQCLKLFSLEGEYQGKINTPGAWVHGPVFAKDYFVTSVCWSDIDGKNVDNSGYVSIFDNHDKVVVNLGAGKPEYRDNQLQPMTTTWDIFNHPHGICIDNDDNIYVGQWRAGQSYPIKLEKIG
ncbi:6-bladed beta-propeller [Thalassotalea sp. PS06]|uniref:6-bladed beta-propeller n=1 Tax=Thalassotalea sp. PS06 TaxID=2594005 RepID=UPI001162F626|nr:6-bladed beta-propeller [Thalassotalea sp. PS06]QDP00787.1 6-bladed beta-propeller [Thalassotalea sp. PS06]